MTRNSQPRKTGSTVCWCTPTVPVLPATLAIAERGGVSGKELMLAYQVGVEVECKIAEAISPRHYQDGFHSTGTCGPFGSGSASAKLLGFDPSKIRNVFGLVASQSGGLRENFGTMTKPFQAGHAAESGLASADLVALGWAAAERILEADRGFFHAFGGSLKKAQRSSKGVLNTSTGPRPKRRRSSLSSSPWIRFRT